MLCNLWQLGGNDRCDAQRWWEHSVGRQEKDGRIKAIFDDRLYCQDATRAPSSQADGSDIALANKLRRETRTMGTVQLTP